MIKKKDFAAGVIAKSLFLSNEMELGSFDDMKNIPQ
jgi:hypothetical protein